MSQRRPIVGGNWKMNLHGAEAEALVKALNQNLDQAGAEVFIAPAFPYLAKVAGLLKKQGPIRLCAQDVYPLANGAYTGEVSCSMLKDVGVEMVLVGHSERRHVIGETDVQINAKLRAALAAGLEAVLCVGEKLEQREAGQTDAVNIAQLHYGLAGVKAADLARVVIAYEPVWAIGTGKTAMTADAQSAHAAIRGALAGLYGKAAAEKIRIQYGGSVKPDNAAELFSQPDVDGFLVGGASLKASDFTAIVQAAGAAVAAG